MSEMAKSARKALKSKAERLVSDPQKKVDSSTWTPPEPLNADVKTGLRPLSRRAFKSGGKVQGEASAARADKPPRAYANAKVNRNVKDANEEREGVKHVGGMKSGGRTKKANGGGSDMPSGVPDSDRAKLMEMMQQIERSRGSEARALRDAEQMYQGRPGNVPARELYSAEQMKRLERGFKKGGRVEKQMGGPMMQGPDPRLGMVSPTRMKFSGAQGTPYKKGGRAKDKSFDEIRKEYGTQVMQKGGKVHGDEAMDKALIKKMVKKSALEKCEGGSATRMARKDGGRAKGKTHINIVVNAGKKDETPIGMPAPGMPPMGRPPAMPVPAPAPAGVPPMAMPGAGLPPGLAGGMPAPGPAGNMPPPSMMARKSGGRVSKKASSYKDMEAGAGSGEGRLQKTDIAKRLPKPRENGKNVYDGEGYPNKVTGATGGRTAKKVGGGVYRSYKDMDAGAGSGEGRLEKTAIQRGKRGR